MPKRSMHQHVEVGLGKVGELRLEVALLASRNSLPFELAGLAYRRVRFSVDYLYITTATVTFFVQINTRFVR